MFISIADVSTYESEPFKYANIPIHDLPAEIHDDVFPSGEYSCILNVRYLFTLMNHNRVSFRTEAFICDLLSVPNLQTFFKINPDATEVVVTLPEHIALNNYVYVHKHSFSREYLKFSAFKCVSTYSYEFMEPAIPIDCIKFGKEKLHEYFGHIPIDDVQDPKTINERALSNAARYLRLVCLLRGSTDVYFLIKHICKTQNEIELFAEAGLHLQVHIWPNLDSLAELSKLVGRPSAYLSATPIDSMYALMEKAYFKGGPVACRHIINAYLGHIPAENGINSVSVKLLVEYPEVSNQIDMMTKKAQSLTNPSTQNTYFQEFTDPIKAFLSAVQKELRLLTHEDSHASLAQFTDVLV